MKPTRHLINSLPFTFARKLHEINVFTSKYNVFIPMIIKFEALLKVSSLSLANFPFLFLIMYSVPL